MTLRVVPVAAGAHAGLRGPFVILEFTEEPALVYLENHGTELFLEEEADLAAYRVALGTILSAALAPAATTELIAQIATEVSGSACDGPHADWRGARDACPGPE